MAQKRLITVAHGAGESLMGKLKRKASSRTWAEAKTCLKVPIRLSTSPLSPLA
ncbi:MAG: hypothetical protein V3U51_02375 [Thermoplasmata archaeon]